MYASMQGAEESIGLLIDAGADAGLVNKERYTALDLARQAGNESVIALLEDSNSKKGILGIL
jgi:ankyrin repeat protein